MALLEHTAKGAEDVPVFGEAHAFAVSLEQRHAHGALQPLDGAGKPLLGNEQLLSRPRVAARIGKFCHIGEYPRIH